MKSIIIHDWMLAVPKLNGYKLLIFATVYHFSFLGSGCFMSVKSWLSLLHCSRSQFFKARNELLSAGLIRFDYDRCVYVCCEMTVKTSVHMPSMDNDFDYPMRSWEELITILTKSDNETAESNNATVESDNETLPF